MNLRQESRRRWTRSAPGWEAHADELARSSMPVSVRMVEMIDPQPGDSLLELAAGPGDTGFLAAELIEPGGTLITSDFVPEMLAVAQRRARARGVRNVRFRQIDAETAIDIEAASIDGVICRWGYMLMADPGTALRETRRVLKPGGRLALAAWAAPDDNLWSALPMRELIRRGLVEPPDPSDPGQFTWAEEGVIADHLEAAGFVEYEVDSVAFSNRYASLQDWWDTTLEISMRIADAVAGVDEATIEEVKAAIGAAAAPFTADDGSIELGARTWIAAAIAP